MEHRPASEAPVVGGAGRKSVLQSSEDWRLAREAQADLTIVGTRGTNLLLMGTAGAIRIVQEMLWMDLREPVMKWRPGQPLELPPTGRAATLILHDVGELTHDEQQQVFHWLDQTAGEIRVVSTTGMPLWPRVKAGTFNDALYYRLNTVCVDVGASNN